jgi:hypothetical protein
MSHSHAWHQQPRVALDMPFALLQIPDDQLPKYKNHKDHLAAVDADLVSRVTTEFWAAFGDVMTQHEIPRQQYVKGFREK